MPCQECKRRKQTIMKRLLSRILRRLSDERGVLEVGAKGCCFCFYCGKPCATTFHYCPWCGFGNPCDLPY